MGTMRSPLASTKISPLNSVSSRVFRRPIRRGTMGSPLAFTKISPLNSLAFRSPKEPLPSQLPIFPFSSFPGEICISWAITPTAMWAIITHDRTTAMWYNWSRSQQAEMWRRFARNGGGGKVKLTEVLHGFLNSEEAGLFLVAGALCGASITVGGVGRVVYDWVIDAEAKEAKALLAWRRSKLEALQASTEEMKGIKESIVEFTKVLKMPRPAAKEPPTTGTGGSA